MRITREGLNMSSSAAATVDDARRWAKFLEDREAKRSGQNVDEARPAVARRVGAAPGTLQNLRKNRLKSIAAHVYGGLRAWVIRELEAEKAALEHELQILRQQGVDPREEQVEEAQASLAEVRSALGLEPAE